MRLLACLLLLFVAIPAVAFVSEPELDPNPAMAGQVVNLLIQTGICNAILGGENPTITVSDNQVEVVIDGLRYSDAWCFFPIIDHAFPLGVFPPGEYVVSVDYRFQQLIGPPETEHLGDLPLSILGLPPQPVPGIGWGGMSVLILLILGATSCARRGI